MINLRNLMLSAHREAKKMVKAVGDYMVALKLALKKEWAKMTAKSAAEKLQELKGWNRWTKYGKDRIYFDLVDAEILDIDYRKSGNISAAYFNGSTISKAEASRLKDVKVYVDVEENQVSKPHFSYSTKLEYTDELDALIKAVKDSIASVVD